METNKKNVRSQGAFSGYLPANLPYPTLHYRGGNGASQTSALRLVSRGWEGEKRRAANRTPSEMMEPESPLANSSRRFLSHSLEGRLDFLVND